jgi:oligopeptidase A
MNQSIFQTNPLLNWTTLPDFEAITAEHVQPAMEAVLAQAETDLTALEGTDPAEWYDLLVPMEKLADRVERTWSVVSHLHGVRNTPDLRAAYENIQPRVVAFSNRLAQSEGIYLALTQFRESDSWNGYSSALKRCIETSIRDRELTGVGLSEDKRTTFNANTNRLAELATRFSNNVLDATRTFTMELFSRDDIQGLPDSLLGLAAQTARAKGHPEASPEHGPWVITLDMPSFIPFMQHSTRRDLREKLYRVVITRASDGDLNNTPLMDEILALRRERAVLLGFSTYAELSLSRKMAPGADRVEDLLFRLRDAARPAADRDMEDLRELARSLGAPEAEDMCHWDIPFWAERLREKRFSLNEEELRPYFPLPRVLDGLFELIRELFNVQIRESCEQVPVWNQAVRYFRVEDSAGNRLASFYLDPYSRPEEKRGGAWMSDLVGRSAVLAPTGSAVRLPVAFICCNQTPPVDDTPSLMTFREVTTLFHEFGHALQHMLTTVDLGPVAGINNVEWDAVELASQFMENWCYHRPTLERIAAHYKTGASLPEETINSILAARTFREGSNTLRQVFFGLMDMDLHLRHDPAGTETPAMVQERLARETLTMPTLAEDRFLCSFSHIFAGGYAAGYYSYKWAEVLSADGFAAFEEAGLDDPAAVQRLGGKFRNTVLALGGSRHPMEVFTLFRGREPRIDALIRHMGLEQKEEEQS